MRFVHVVKSNSAAAFHPDRAHQSEWVHRRRPKRPFAVYWSRPPTTFLTPLELILAMLRNLDLVSYISSSSPYPQFWAEVSLRVKSERSGVFLTLSPSALQPNRLELNWFGVERLQGSAVRIALYDEDPRREEHGGGGPILTADPKRHPQNYLTTKYQLPYLEDDKIRSA